MTFPRIVKEAAARRDEFLDVARRLFGSNGYDATSVGQIIAEMGVSKGAFYHHFESKEDLLEAIACRYAEASAAGAQAILDDPTLDSFARLTSFLARMRAYKLETAAELRLTFEPLFRAENIQLYFRTQSAITSVVRPLLARIIAEGVAERTFDTPDPDSAAEIIMHLMTANRDLVMALYAARTPLEFERASRRLLDKIAYLGTVIDRILGLPEGSLELADREAICALAGSLGPSESAA